MTRRIKPFGPQSPDSATQADMGPIGLAEKNPAHKTLEVNFPGGNYFFSESRIYVDSGDFIVTENGLEEISLVRPTQSYTGDLYITTSGRRYQEFEIFGYGRRISD